MTKVPTETRILDAAQRMMMQRGYNGFSFRDVAAEIGIKSASVHYHFPTKSDLGQTAARRYCDRFMSVLLETEEHSLAARLGLYVSHFRRTLEQDGSMCLCGVLGAEASSLPEKVTNETKRFFAANREWLTSQLRRAQAGGEVDPAMDTETEARLFFATLQGAMLCAKTTAKIDVFDEIAAAALTRLFLVKPPGQP